MSKVPVKTDKATYIGIEVEFFTSRDAAAMFRTHGIREYADIGTDGSIEPEDLDERGSELRILCKYQDLKKVMPILKSYLETVKAKVNQSCGLHIHLDMRGKDVSKAFGNLIAKQDQMYKSIPNYRRGSEYCKRVESYDAARTLASLDYKPIKREEVAKEVKALLKKFNVAEQMDGWDTDDIIGNIMNAHEDLTGTDTSHYDGISADPFISGKYKTLEIRIHEATLDTAEIQDWVTYLYDVAFKGTLSESSALYIKRRIRKYG